MATRAQKFFGYPQPEPRKYTVHLRPEGKSVEVEAVEVRFEDRFVKFFLEMNTLANAFQADDVLSVAVA